MLTGILKRHAACRLQPRTGRRTRRRGLPATILTSLAAVLLPAGQISAADTLAKIAATGKITIGHRQNELPFSYVVDGQVVGYSTDICRAIVDGVRRELKLGKLEVVYVPVTTATRFILIRNGSIDMECAATTNNAERRKLAEFSFPHFVTATRFVSNKKDAMDAVADLAGRSVVSTTGIRPISQYRAKR